MSIVTRSRSRIMDAGGIFLRVKAQGESLGLSGDALVKYVTEAEAKAEERKAEAEAKAEERKAEAEAKAEERKAEAEAEERRLKAEERRAEQEFELEKLRLEAGTNTNDNAANPSRSGSHHEHRDKFRVKLPYLEDRDDLETYLRTFERTAHIQDWPLGEWAPRLGTLLKGKAREVYSMLSDHDAGEYDILRKALLNRFRLTAEEYRKKFREAKRLPGESTQEYAARIDLWLTRWQELASKKDTYEELRDMIMQEKFLGGIPYDQARFVREHEPSDMSDAVRFATLFETAKYATATDHDRPRRFEQVKNNRDKRDQERHQVSSVQEGHKNNKEGDRSAPKHRGEHSKVECYICGGPHIARVCPRRKSSAEQQGGRSAAAVADILDSKPQEGGKLCRTCENVPFSPECEILVEGTRVTALRDTGATITIVQSDLVPERCRTGRTIEIVLASSPEKRTLQIARVGLDTPYFKDNTEVVLMDRPVCPVLIGNYRKSDTGELTSVSVYPVREVCAAVQTRAAAKRLDHTLNLPSSLLGDVTPEELSKSQKEDPTLANVRRLAERKTAISERQKKGKGTVATYQWKGEILYRIYSDNGKEYKQVVVPKQLRQEVLRLAHDIPMAGD
eukprot:TRINITY_DN9715_c0_g1_i8.p1 TRINITY_DN9715_c0_g1~~TRINITY_DN9715_c0_g1_i8.p1  ORF type:complete len:621 (-),score=88.70 TRINITY_DN9715_c0_g1_i8:1898-3760(-)